jgi:glycosyltransferase involved in cell wall biosynthesis
MLINLSFIFSEPTGISTYALNLVPYLKSLSPTLLLPENLENSLLNQYQSDFNCYPVPNNLTPEQGIKGHLNRLFWTQFKLPQIYDQFNSSLLFSPVSEMPIYSQCSSVVTIHDLIPLRFPGSFFQKLYFTYYFPLVLHQAKHIICNSQTTADDLIKFFNISASKITPTLLAYNSQHFRPLTVNNNKNNKPYFLYFGRHVPYKNISGLIAAFAALPNNQNYELWIAGSADPRYTPQLKLQVQELGIENQVKFLDYLKYEQLPLIINQAIAVVFPSLWEGFGLPVLEAMACGTPVITSNISALKEIAQEAALLINPYEIKEITQAMLSLIQDDQLREDLRNLGLARANQFSWQKTGQETVEILRNFL